MIFVEMDSPLSIYGMYLLALKNIHRCGRNIGSNLDIIPYSKYIGKLGVKLENGEI